MCGMTKKAVPFEIETLPFNVGTGKRLNFQNIESDLWLVPVRGQKARIRIEMNGCAAAGAGALDGVKTAAETTAFPVRECTRLKDRWRSSAFLTTSATR